MARARLAPEFNHIFSAHTRTLLSPHLEKEVNCRAQLRNRPKPFAKKITQKMIDERGLKINRGMNSYLEPVREAGNFREPENRVKFLTRKPQDIDIF